jgi:hypothetical protein
MVRKILGSLVVVLAFVALTAPSAQAQARQSVSFNLGYFATRAEDARPSGDVLVENLNFLLFNLKDFNGATVGGDWLIDMGEFLEGGVGIAYHRRSVPSVYSELVGSDGFEIAQDLKLRVTPIMFTVRFLPFGHRNSVQPYVGAGVGLFNWRYAETGEFVDRSDDSIFRASYVDQGNDVGTVILGGIRAPVGDIFAAGVELQYHDANGSLDTSKGFFGDKVDLSGWTTQFTLRMKF